MVGGVVRGFGPEIGEPAGARHDPRHPVESHAGIHMALRQRGEGSVGPGVELDEHMVPDLDAPGGVLVDQPAAGLAVGRQVKVDLAARAAGSGVSHHPEVVLLAAGQDVRLRVKTLGLEDSRPDGMGFRVELGRVAGSWLVDGGVKPGGRDPPDPGQQLPTPGQRLLLEIVPERPVAQHLEEGVVVGVEADVLEVVVFASGPDALLGVGRPRVGRLHVTEKVGHELVHTRIGEQQIGGAGQEGGRGHHGMAALGKEIEEGLAKLGGGHGGRGRRTED